MCGCSLPGSSTGSDSGPLTDAGESLDAGPGASPDAGGSADSGTDSGSAPSVDIPDGGTVLFQESFDDTNFIARGWTNSGGILSTTEHIPGSRSSFECDFAVGSASCTGGSPVEHLYTPTETIYVAFSLKLSANWVGSGLPYHPHMINLATTEDAVNWNPSNSHLTTYEEVVWDAKTDSGTALLGLQDELNVDNNCIIFADGTFADGGCNGNPQTYVFTEHRSVCACNRVVGDFDQRDCFYDPQSSPAQGEWYSSRGWRSLGAFTDANKNDWHFIEVYFAMNSIQNGIGVPDGKMRWVQDGQTLLSLDHILFRTGQFPTMEFLKFLFGFYIGPPGAPVAEKLWIDDLTVATARP